MTLIHVLMSAAPFFMGWSVTTTARDRRSDTIAARRINPETPENNVQSDRMRHHGCASGTQPRFLFPVIRYHTATSCVRYCFHFVRRISGHIKAVNVL